ncbi:hypothetical protein [Microbacterium sp. SORGH_AS_0862]|uniref:hypothetical protein n=1 Tax=Microbacterium sp. SORGH_AS_0862 TaxID=3041789 RepID=UPI00278F4852|nr:hypothetical protein [Microbacterium sp. SORGH_AS_0862]MDQ1206834.1 hypothetical protein [Microbacterium sp. SORGH_AS_0862]
MANDSFARVAITTDDVGDELDRYIRVAAHDGYCILHDPIRREGTGRVARFQGFATGRWAYETNLRGFFGDASGWRDGAQRSAWQELLTALRRTKGRIRFEIVDSEEGMAWFARQSAEVRVNWRSAPKIHVATHSHEELVWPTFADALGLDADVIDVDLEFDAMSYVRQTAVAHGELPTRSQLIAWARTPGV